MRMRKLNEVYATLLKEHSPQGWWPLIKKGKVIHHPSFTTKRLTKSERFEICTGAILTQNTNWGNVEKALLNLHKEHLLSAEKIANIPHKRLARLITPSGYFNQKATKLKIFSRFSLTLKGRTPTREELLSLWGIGKETADSILLYAFNVPCFVVDAYTKRIASRLGLISLQASYDEIKAFFEDNLPSDSRLYKEYHALLVAHAKKYYSKKHSTCPLYKRFRFS